MKACQRECKAVLMKSCENQGMMEAPQRGLFMEGFASSDLNTCLQMWVTARFCATLFVSERNQGIHARRAPRGNIAGGKSHKG
jgi:hypothetical protein